MHRWGGDHTVERGEAMLVANLLAVELKLRLRHLSIHIQSYHRLGRERQRKDRLHLSVWQQSGERRDH